jgi:hypothetical protein
MAGGVAAAGGGRACGDGGCVTKPRRWGAAAVVALLLAGVAGWWGRDGGAPTAPAVSVAAPSTAGPSGAASAPQSAWEATVAAGRTATLAHAAPVVASNATEAAPTSINLDLCGVGPVTIRRPPKGSKEESFDALPRPLGHLARAEAWTQVLATMEADPTERSRAAALVLRASGLLWAEPSLLGPVSLPDTSPYVRQLAALAAHTRDAGVLRWALAVCDRGKDAAECQALSVQQLVALAPDDGRHWLLLAAADPKRRSEALRRAANAPTVGSMPPLWPAVNAAIPAGLPPYITQDLLLMALGVGYGLPDGSLFGVVRDCERARGEDRTTCLALADALYLRGQDLMALGIGRVLGERLGWPAERVAAARAERYQLSAAFEPIATDQPYTCTAVQRSNALLRDIAQFGEVATLRRLSAAAAASAAAPR